MKKMLKTVSLIILGFSFTGLCLAQSTSAPAAGTASEGYGSSAIAQILMLAAFAFIFYFLVFRPQNKRMKEHRDLVTKIQKGDEVLTSGGLIGRISRVADDFFVVMIAEGIEVLVQKQAISQALPKGTMKSLQT